MTVSLNSGGLTSETLEPRARSVLRGALQFKPDLDVDRVLRIATACMRLPTGNGTPVTDLSCVAEALSYERFPGGIEAWCMDMVKTTPGLVRRARQVWTAMGEESLWSD